ncbi:MAG TPA: TlpA disulfide reductase family protein [Terriglobales bacterium]|nr:TlpA disulfide reductase family protein [Terriglobales bacterium]
MQRTLPILTVFVLLLAAAIGGYFFLFKATPSEDAPSLPATSSSVAGNAASEPSPVIGRFEPIEAQPSLAGVVISDSQGDVDLGRYKGKALLLNIWATWCAPCVAEMPSLDRLQAKLGSDRFAVVTVAVDEPNMGAVEDFMKKYQLQNLPVLLDVNHAIDHQVRIQSLPTSLLVTPEGKVVARFTGDNKWNCGKPLAALDDFAKDGTVPTNILDPCAE